MSSTWADVHCSRPPAPRPWPREVPELGVAASPPTSSSHHQHDRHSDEKSDDCNGDDDDGYDCSSAQPPVGGRLGFSLRRAACWPNREVAS